MQNEDMLKVLVMKVTKNLKKELFVHVIFQPEEVLLLCETLDLLQGTGLLLQVNFLFAEQLKDFSISVTVSKIGKLAFTDVIMFRESE